MLLGTSTEITSRGRATHNNRITLGITRTASMSGTLVYTPPSQRSGSLPRRALGLARSRTNSMATIAGLTRTNSQLGQLRRTGSLSLATGNVRAALSDSHTNIPAIRTTNANMNPPAGILESDTDSIRLALSRYQGVTEADALAAEMEGLGLAKVPRTPSPQTADLWSVARSPVDHDARFRSSSPYSSPASRPCFWFPSLDQSPSVPGPRSPVSPSAPYSRRSSSGHAPLHRLNSLSKSSQGKIRPPSARKRSSQPHAKAGLIGHRVPSDRRKVKRAFSLSDRAHLTSSPGGMFNVFDTDAIDRMVE